LIMIEEWKPVTGYEGLYEVSNIGRVRSLDRIVNYSDGRVRSFAGGIRKLIVTQYGYHSVEFKAQDRKERILVHRLVAREFIPNPENLPFVMHLDDNRTNNVLVNLRWGTCQDNTDDKVSKNRQLKGTEIKQAVLTESAVSNIRYRLLAGCAGRSLASEYGVSEATISHIKHNHNWSHVK
jgi:hypothetical protein